MANLKQKIILALHEKKETYQGFPSFEPALKFFIDDNNMRLEDLTAGPGYFKYFFKNLITDDVATNDPTHAVARDLARYLQKKDKPASAGPGRLPIPEAITQEDIDAFQITTFSPGQVVVDPNMFQYYLTNTEIDEIFSDDGGAMAATSIMVSGGPGVGKSTLLFWMVSVLRALYPDKKIAIVSSEMEREDLLYEAIKKPWMNTLDFILTAEYESNLDMAIRKIFYDGFDIILLDSFADICEKLKDFCGYTTSKAENFLLARMKEAKGGKNKTGAFTLTLAIQQVTKSGNFAGSNKLKHNTTGMLELRRESSGDRYMVFTKNRRCGIHVGKKLYYFLGANNAISFDSERWEREKAGDEQTTDTSAEDANNTMLLGKFGELNDEQANRLRLAMQQFNVTPEVLLQLQKGYTPPIAIESLNLPEGISFADAYHDATLGFWVLDLGAGETPAFGTTEEDLKQKLFDRFGEPTEEEIEDLVEENEE